MTNLYDITTDIKHRIDEVLEQDWLDETTLSTLLPAIKSEAMVKQKSVAAYILNKKSDIEQRKQAIEKIEALIHTDKNHVDKLEKLLLRSMQTLEQDKIDCVEFVIKLKNNPPKVVINNEMLVPEEFMRIKTIKEADKAKIGDELKKEGGSVAGCHLDSGQRLEIK